MYGKPFKMMGKSPMMKKLVGKQNNLPAELKAKIEASPAKKKKVTVEKVGNDTRKTITRTRRDGTIKKRKVILSTPDKEKTVLSKNRRRAKVKKVKGTAGVTVQRYDKQGNKLRKIVNTKHDGTGSNIEVNDSNTRFRKTRKKDTKE